MRTILAIAPLALLGGIASAQQVPPTTIPSVFRGAHGSVAILAPLARTRLFMQTVYSGTSFPKPVGITALGWRAHPSVVAPATAIRMEVVCDNVRNLVLSKLFTANLTSSATTVVRLKTLNFPAVNRPSDPIPVRGLGRRGGQKLRRSVGFVVEGWSVLGHPLRRAAQRARRVSVRGGQPSIYRWRCASARLERDWNARL